MRARPAGGLRAKGRAALLLLMATLAAAPSCSPRRAAQTPSERLQSFLDSGNQAYRTGDYALAARRYAAGAAIDPNEPACYFGLGMALNKLRRSEEARAAYQRARELAARRDTSVLEGAH